MPRAPSAVTGPTWQGPDYPVARTHCSWGRNALKCTESQTFPFGFLLSFRLRHCVAMGFPPSLEGQRNKSKVGARGFQRAGVTGLQQCPVTSSRWVCPGCWGRGVWGRIGSGSLAFSSLACKPECGPGCLCLGLFGWAFPGDPKLSPAECLPPTANPPLFSPLALLSKPGSFP